MSAFRIVQTKLQQLQQLLLQSADCPTTNLLPGMGFWEGTGPVCVHVPATLVHMRTAGCDGGTCVHLERFQNHGVAPVARVTAVDLEHKGIPIIYYTSVTPVA
jgi:hypothetical protein